MLRILGYYLCKRGALCVLLFFLQLSVSLAQTSSANVTYTAPFPNSIPITQEKKNAQTVNVDDFGAKGDGQTDDSAALIAAISAFDVKGGVVQLTCGKKYFINQNIVIGKPGISIRGCWRFPELSLYNKGSGDPNFLGDVNDIGKIIRGPNVTITIGDSGGLDELAIFQQGIVVPMADTSSYKGTAVALSPGGNGVSAHMNQVLIIGGEICFDGHWGGAWVRLFHVAVDCTSGLYAIGNSGGSSHYDDVDASVLGTQGFGGYPITNVTGDGTTTTVNFSYPSSIANPTAFLVGETVMLLDTYSNTGTKLYPSNYGYTITSASLNARTGTISFSSNVNTITTPVGTKGAVQNVTRQYRRAGVGIGFGSGSPASNGCDDTHIGRMAEFGYNIGLDFQCNGIFNADHLWADNSQTVGLRIGSSSQSVSEVHINSVHVAGIGGVGFQLNSSPSFLSNIMIDKLSVIGNSSDCVEVNGIMQFGMAHVENCSLWGFNVGASSKLYGDSVYANGLSQQLFVPGPPAEYMQIAHVFTDVAAGGSLYGGRLRQMPTLASSATLSLPVTSVNENLETYAVSGSAEVSTIGSCWSGRNIRLILTGTAKLTTGGNIASPAGGTSGTIVDLVCDGSTTPSLAVWRRPQ